MFNSMLKAACAPRSLGTLAPPAPVAVAAVEEPAIAVETRAEQTARLASLYDSLAEPEVPENWWERIPKPAYAIAGTASFFGLIAWKYRRGVKINPSSGVTGQGSSLALMEARVESQMIAIGCILFGGILMSATSGGEKEKELEGPYGAR
eukprot:CAMPEP_0205819294 /NCGR_PEP_ID=MMETSP0206-20130828/1600_1 /ASSEMBLY_ACC=CAM_ASM_000279 /TAXON_ID=36767 /ORGANISM="Euplotes focardii, Strain TN1" /LENGTH=149 /DNA_ID=CAMNT_0053112703 /DNA_START=36 /DNA_END=485 /DNA_ORIENTATION=+